MIDFSDALVIDHYKRLSADLKSRLFNDETAEAVFSICSHLHLSLEQINACAEDVDLFLLGMTAPEEFPTKLSTRTALGPDLTNQIVAGLDAKIFSSVREALKALYQVTDIAFPKLVAPQAPRKAAQATPAQREAISLVQPSTRPAQTKEVMVSNPPTNSSGASSLAPVSKPAPVTISLEKKLPVSDLVKKDVPLAQAPNVIKTIPIGIEKRLIVTPPAPIHASSKLATPASPTPPPPPFPKSNVEPIEIKAPQEKKLELIQISAAQDKTPAIHAPSPFIDPLPKKAIESATIPSTTPRRPLNWSDVLAAQHKESIEPSAVHSNLERALNSGSPVQSKPTAPAPKSYQSKDPYREPLE